MSFFPHATQHPIGSIMVGVDGSSPSRAAIKWAVHRAARTGAHVTLTHIAETDPYKIRTDDDTKWRERGVEKLQPELDYANLIDRHVQVSAELLHGDPLEQLAAASEHIALLVLGTHKTGFVQGRVFGSTFIPLAAVAKSPVAFIPDSATRREGGVVVGVGDAVEEKEIIRFAADEAYKCDQELTIINCWQTPKHATEADLLHPDVNFAATFSRSVLDEAETIAEIEHPGLAIRLRSLHRPTAQALVDASLSASLLIIGRSHTNAYLPGVIGPVVHDVLLNLAGPAVIVHDAAPLSYHFSRRAHEADGRISSEGFMMQQRG